MRSGITWVAACTALLIGGAATSATASTITFDFNTEFSNGQAPAGPAPWIVVTFSDTSTPGMVQLTVTTGGLTGNENITGLYFNINPALNVSNLAFQNLNGASGTIAASSIQLGEDSFKPDGDGLYDLLLSYPTGSGPGTFNHSVSSAYDITYRGSGTLSASSFYFLSTRSGGHGPFYAAAHVQNTTGTGQGGSGWVAPVPAPVPLPAGAWFLMSGLAGLAGVAGTRAALRS